MPPLDLHPREDEYKHREPDRGVFPTFLVVGAPHSGALALSALLRRLPTIYLPANECAFFEQRFGLGPRWYQDRFHPPTQACVVGDLSTTTLGGDTDHAIVAARIDGFLPQVRMVAVLRDPVERALVHYRELVLDGKVPADIPVQDYLERARENEDPHAIVSSGCYGQHLLPFVQRFRRRLELIDHRELVRSPTKVVVNVAKHIGATITEEPRAGSDDRDSDGVGHGFSNETQRGLEPYFEDDLEMLERVTGFRFPDPPSGRDRTSGATSEP